MAFLDTTTRVVKAGDEGKTASIIIKDTVTVEDITFMYARTAAVNKLSAVTLSPDVPANVRKQVTRVPHVR
jgi:hypothetical protein